MLTPRIYFDILLAVLIFVLPVTRMFLRAQEPPRLFRRINGMEITVTQGFLV